MNYKAISAIGTVVGVIIAVYTFGDTIGNPLTNHIVEVGDSRYTLKSDMDAVKSEFQTIIKCQGDEDRMNIIRLELEKFPESEVLVDDLDRYQTRHTNLDCKAVLDL